MIELIDTLPDVNVQPAEYRRLLGYPRDRVVEGRARELAEWARGWCAKHGRPWVYAREAQDVSRREDDGVLRIDGRTFASKPLCRTLAQADAGGVVLVAVSAGPELEAEAARLWLAGKPDEYFFLEVFGSAVVEHLITSTGARLCAWADRQGMAVLPHYSPGYAEWNIAQQPRLLELMRDTCAKQPLPGAIDVLESGMLRPRKSLLAVFGLTARMDRVKKLTELIACESCSFVPCQYRRAPYRRSSEPSLPLPQRSEVAAVTLQPMVASPISELRPAASAKYQVNVKALRRWADERLSLTFHDAADDRSATIVAHFRYEGTTCSNMGRALHFNYHVTLGPRAAGYPILDLRCGPAAGDEGHRFMCRYMTNAEHLMVAIDLDKPLLGRPLNDVLDWKRPLTAPACYCEPNSRKHKWGIVLETIHFALARHESQALASANAAAAAVLKPVQQELTPEEAHAR